MKGHIQLQMSFRNLVFDKRVWELAQSPGESAETFFKSLDNFYVDGPPKRLQKRCYVKTTDLSDLYLP